MQTLTAMELLTAPTATMTMMARLTLWISAAVTETRLHRGNVVAEFLIPTAT
jgi:hypothetical protein